MVHIGTVVEPSDLPEVPHNRTGIGIQDVQIGVRAKLQ